MKKTVAVLLATALLSIPALAAADIAAPPKADRVIGGAVQKPVVPSAPSVGHMAKPGVPSVGNPLKPSMPSAPAVGNVTKPAVPSAGSLVKPSVPSTPSVGSVAKPGVPSVGNPLKPSVPSAPAMSGIAKPGVPSAPSVAKPGLPSTGLPKPGAMNPAAPAVGGAAVGGAAMVPSKPGTPDVKHTLPPRDEKGRFVSSKNAMVVRANAESKVYHVPGCRYYNAAGNDVKFGSKADAARHGYRPCKVCSK